MVEIPLLLILLVQMALKMGYGDGFIFVLTNAHLDTIHSMDTNWVVIVNLLVDS